MVRWGEHCAHSSRAHVHQGTIDEAPDGGSSDAMEIRRAQRVGEVVVGMCGIECGDQIGKCTSSADLTQRTKGAVAREVHIRQDDRWLPFLVPGILR